MPGLAALAGKSKRSSADERGLLDLANGRVLVAVVGPLGRGALDIEQVADALERPDPARLARRGAELPADSADPDSQVLQVVAVLGTPDLRQELRVEDDLARVRGPVLEAQPLGPGQLDQLATARDHASLEVDLDV